jgi:hypothetical protein
VSFCAPKAFKGSPCNIHYSLEAVGISVNRTTASHLMAILLELGYFDNQLYITSTNEFSDWDDEQEDIIKLAFPDVTTYYIPSTQRVTKQGDD